MHTRFTLMVVGALALALGACDDDDDDDDALVCGAGTHEVDGECVPDSELDCGAGTHEVDGECVPDSELDCGAGTHEVDGECVPDSELDCGAGTHEANGECVPDVVCGEGTHALADVCVPDQITDVDEVVIGELLYFDTNLSTPAGQSCASCHAPDSGFADPDRDLPVSRGVNPWSFGNRNSPTAAYAAFSPDFAFDADEGLYVGGQFWDGRAANLVEQAKGPFLNPLEMNNVDEDEVIGKIAASRYADLFRAVYGEDVFENVESAYQRMAEAIAAFEASAEVNRFTSKYDFYLAGQAELTAEEASGLALFDDEARGNCAACHPSTGQGDAPPMFTDFTYDNLGVPRNPANPFYDLPAEHNPDGIDFVDLGLGGALGEAAENGKMKVPTLRNIALTAPYMHNGVFATLEEVVEFYNSRDLGGFGPPEVAENVNEDELGDLGLTAEEVSDIVAFLRTLSDGWVPEP